MENKIAYILSLIFLVVGLFFLINSQASITGAVIGASAVSSKTGFFAGASLILASFILFILGINKPEEKKQETNQTKE